MSKYKPTCKGYFSGAGLMEIGLMRSGVKMIQSLDIDDNSVSCMQMNQKYFNHRIIHGDISNELVLDKERSDIMVFTYPCTKYSAAADINGTRTGDELFLHALRHIAVERPEMYIVENVPGMKKFKIVMEAMTRLPDYYVNVFCPINASTWLPQKRERLIVIATKKPFLISEPRCKKRVTMKDIIEKNPIYEMPQYVLNRINGEYRDKPIIVDPGNPNAMAPTCVAHYSKDLGTRLVKDKNSKHGLRPFSIREYARLQGVPDDYVFPEKKSSYQLIGNGVAVPMGEWCGKQAMRYFN
jgi:DNA (cytosine-5)-methyltransferase 1